MVGRTETLQRIGVFHSKYQLFGTFGNTRFSNWGTPSVNWVFGVRVSNAKDRDQVCGITGGLSPLLRYWYVRESPPYGGLRVPCRKVQMAVAQKPGSKMEPW